MERKSDSDVIKMYSDYNNGTSMKDIAVSNGCTVGNIQYLFKSRGLVARLSKRFDLDQNYFSSIDGPKKAYILGFIAADGGLDENRVVLKVSSKDVCILEMARDAMGSNADIHHRAGRAIRGGKYTQADYSYIRFCSRKMVVDLIKIGVTPRKSLTLKPPVGIPDEFVKYFILGYFDGDGTIFDKNPKNPRFAMLGTPEFLGFVQDFLVKNAGLTAGHIRKKHDSEARILSWGGAKNAVKWREFMYDTDEEFSLKRKRDRFFTFNRIKRPTGGREVVQLDLSGNVVASWPNGVPEIAKMLLFCKRNIYRSIHNPEAIAHGFKWIYKQ